MRYLMAVLLVACTSSQELPDAMPDATGEPGVVDPAPCQHFVDLEAGYWRRTAPYIEPVLGRIYVAGAFFPIDGQGDVVGDETLLWAARVYHFENGATQLGAAGSRTFGDSQCEWAVAVRKE